MIDTKASAIMLFTEDDAFLEDLSDEEASALLRAIYHYGKHREVLPLPGGAKIAFKFIKSQIDRCRENYETLSEKRSRAGKMGGRPRKEDDEQENVHKEKAKKQKKQSKAKKASYTDTYTYADTNNIKPLAHRRMGDGDESSHDEAPKSQESDPTELSATCGSVEERSEDPTEQEKDSGRDAKNDHFDQRFDRFWAAYPRKVAKKRAQQVFKRLRLSDADFDDLMKALAVHMQTDQWTRDGGQYIPHPSTWLGQERWKDDVTLPRPSERPYRGKQPPANAWSSDNPGERAGRAARYAAMDE